MTDSSGWKLIKLRTSVPIRCRGRRRCFVGLKLESHSRFVTDRCRMMLTERNRKNYGFYVKPVRDFRKLKRQNIRIHFSPIRSTPGFCGFWKGYRLPPIKVNNDFTLLLLVYTCKYYFAIYKWSRLHCVQIISVVYWNDVLLLNSAICNFQGKQKQVVRNSEREREYEIVMTGKAYPRDINLSCR